MLHELEHIIKGCREGNSRAQKELYEYYKSKMFGVCLRYAHSFEDAEDILQDGFLKVFEKIGQFEFKGAFEGWIRKIMVNTALEKHKKEIQIINITDSIKETKEEKNTEVTSEISANELLVLIQDLSPKYRMVFNLYAIEGYSHKEIGKMLNISEGTSKSNLSRARLILQEKIERLYASPSKIGFKK